MCGFKSCETVSRHLCITVRNFRAIPQLNCPYRPGRRCVRIRCPGAPFMNHNPMRSSGLKLAQTFQTKGPRGPAGGGELGSRGREPLQSARSWWRSLCDGIVVKGGRSCPRARSSSQESSRWALEPHLCTVSRCSPDQEGFGARHRH